MVELDLTIAQQAAVFEQDIKKSRFILNIARVANEEEAQTFINDIKSRNVRQTTMFGRMYLAKKTKCNGILMMANPLVQQGYQCLKY
ncbi:uncharacterized protein, YigZ family [Weissella viridescens]|uniref:Uncharacterized protein, YigZ family n=1 Tax=Weissella viridescens TaxID=1629 RepID=A0A380P8D0_WEIVI|nr:uncharacterized protein, YigZ family [Weissella viridescens]